MINIEFWGGQSKDGIHGCNYMIAKPDDPEDYDYDELYAEEIIPDWVNELFNEDEKEFYKKNYDMYGYKECKSQIIEQAKELEIPEAELNFIEYPNANQTWDETLETLYEDINRRTQEVE